jgi:hypothetical protein
VSVYQPRSTGWGAARQPVVSTNTSDISDLQAIKELTARLGANQVKELADVLS